MEGRTRPDLWEKAEKIAFKKFNNIHSARMRQYQGKVYRDLGGGYIGPKTKAQKDLSKWTGENWRTKSGQPSLVTGERYLPENAIKALTGAEYGATTRLKREGMKQGKQYVKQPKTIIEKVKKFR
jgi:hypothetical protein